MKLWRAGRMMKRLAKVAVVLLLVIEAVTDA